MKNLKRYTELFARIGLSPTETRLYLNSLALGPSSVIQLGRKIGITRQMVYTIIRNLTEKGLIKQAEINGRKFFQAVDPQILIDLSVDATESIKTILPDLQSQKPNRQAIPVLTVYENLLSMREWYRHFMRSVKPGEELLIWSSGKIDHWYNLDKDFYDKFLRFSDKNGVKSTILLPDNPQARKYQNTIGSSKRMYRFVKDGWNVNAEKWIWQDQICFLTIGENYSNMIVMESKNMAELERCNFWNIWKHATISH